MNRSGASGASFERRPVARTPWQASAASDLANIREYIALTSPLAAQSVADRVLRAVDHLAAFLESGRIGQVPETREAVVPGLPYVVVYGAQDRRQ